MIDVHQNLGLVTVDLQGCLLENTFFVRCFKENLWKLRYISL